MNTLRSYQGQLSACLKTPCSLKSKLSDRLVYLHYRFWVTFVIIAVGSGLQTKDGDAAATGEHSARFLRLASARIVEFAVRHTLLQGILNYNRVCEGCGNTRGR